MSLRWRLLAVFAVLGALAIGAATLTAWLSTSNELRGEVDAFLVRRGNEVLEGRRQLPQGPGRAGDPRARRGRPPPSPPTWSPRSWTRTARSSSPSAQLLPVDDADLAVAAGPTRSG